MYIQSELRVLLNQVSLLNLTRHGVGIHLLCTIGQMTKLCGMLGCLMQAYLVMLSIRILHKLWWFHHVHHIEQSPRPPSFFQVPVALYGSQQYDLLRFFLNIHKRKSHCSLIVS